MLSLLYRTREKLSFLLLILILAGITLGSSGPGTVYVVIGSDTAIWDGMSTSRYSSNYNPALYVSQFNNTRTIMDPSFRGRFTDSFGDTLSLTWWMMAGNIFRYAVNTNIPYPNIMTMYLMKEFYGDQIKLLGDELSLHYHTFKWTDYNNDGIFWWNQAFGFMESYDDFNFTLSQLFLEEEVFPVSFRSGWHYMDNDWQNYLNKLLPYSLHNDYPAKRFVTNEPIDNNFDWSLAPSAFIPFNPSPGNYQLQGESKGWNVRSIHLNNFKKNNTLLNSIFAMADSGISQVVCIWGHLPETDFNTNIEAVDSVLHKYQSMYPDVKFKYTTGVEAMQLYREGTDFTPPQLTVNESVINNRIEFTILTDEPIFQEQPFVAYKDLNENFHVAECIPAGVNIWKSEIPIDRSLVAKAGVVLTDTMGNQSHKIIRYLPDDIYVDNNNPGYSESFGNWTDNPDFAWGNNSRKVVLEENDSAAAVWHFDVLQKNNYHIFNQFPSISNHAGNITYRIYSNATLLDSITIEGVPSLKKWLYLSTLNLDPGSYSVNMAASGKGQPGKILTADVLKISPLVRDKAIIPLQEYLSLGEMPLDDSITFSFDIKNGGIGTLRIKEIISLNNLSQSVIQLPVDLGAMEKFTFQMTLDIEEVGIYNDTLIIKSDDPLIPVLKIPVSFKILPYFVVVDNEHTQSYSESGTWSNSVAQSYGTSSRFASLNQNPRASAQFQKAVLRSGQYDIFFIVPVTVNAATKALYKVYLNGTLTDSVFVDQNLNSGKWTLIARRDITEGTVVRVIVSDPGGSQGAVLRADAVKIGLYDETSYVSDESNIPDKYYLYQNYPNPFNPATKIKYSVPAGKERVTLAVYDVIGRMVNLLVDEEKSPGNYEVDFNASELSSGVYFCRFNTGSHTSVIKMVLLK